MYTEVSCGISPGGHRPLKNWLCLSDYTPGMAMPK